MVCPQFAGMTGHKTRHCLGSIRKNSIQVLFRFSCCEHPGVWLGFCGLGFEAHGLRLNAEGLGLQTFAVWPGCKSRLRSMGN